MIAEIQRDGETTLSAIAQELEARGVYTGRPRPLGAGPGRPPAGRLTGKPYDNCDSRRPQSSAMVLVCTHHGAVKCASRKTPPIRRTDQSTSACVSIKVETPDLDEQSGDPAGRSFTRAQLALWSAPMSTAAGSHAMPETMDIYLVQSPDVVPESDGNPDHDKVRRIF